MKKLFFFLFFCMVSYGVSAQNDTSAYTAQRNIVNKLLAERSNKFGQYDSSLKRRTGIFGLKTKRDMQASNDILTEIVLTDNEIFAELKILLDYKDFEKKEIQNRAQTVEGRIDRFQSTITRLQQENERLKAERDEEIVKQNRIKRYLLALAVVLAGCVFYILKRNYNRHTVHKQS